MNWAIRGYRKFSSLNFSISVDSSLSDAMACFWICAELKILRQSIYMYEDIFEKNENSD